MLLGHNKLCAHHLRSSTLLIYVFRSPFFIAYIFLYLPKTSSNKNTEGYLCSSLVSDSCIHSAMDSKVPLEHETGFYLWLSVQICYEESGFSELRWWPQFSSWYTKCPGHSWRSLELGKHAYLSRKIWKGQETEIPSDLQNSVYG